MLRYEDVSGGNNRCQGFTLLEVIAVLVIVGIIAVVAASRAINHNAEVYTGADTLKAHLRYAQTMAMNSNLSNSTAPVWGINMTTSAYGLFQGTITTNYVSLPEEESYVNADKTINLTKKKIKLSSTSPIIYFDNRGIPYSSYTNTTDNIPLSASLIISIQPLNSATPSVGVTITPFTGYVP